jgi:hypothetical protein
MKEINKRILPTDWINIIDKKPPHRKVLLFIWNDTVYAGFYDKKVENFYRFTLRKKSDDPEDNITTLAHTQIINVGVKYWAYLPKVKENINE